MGLAPHYMRLIVGAYGVATRNNGLTFNNRYDLIGLELNSSAIISRNGMTMYTEKDYQTKKELLADFKAGKVITVYQPNQMFPISGNGNVCIEGPHYPKPHRWYASAVIENFCIKSLR